ncbi:Kazal-type serine protease inhibitor family protein [Patescibacteria group bacterium]
MRKFILIIVVLVIIGIVGYLIFQLTSQLEPIEETSNEEPEEEIVAFDPKNATYMIEGELYNLVDGKAEKETAPGSATKIITMVWSEPVFGDINRDGFDDAAMIITHDPGGSGTFYYAVTAIRDPETGKAVGKNAILLGDRIAPQNISINEGVILVNYVERLPDEPFTSQPSIGVTRWIVFINNELRELHICSAQEKIADVCTLEYDPVCGDDLVTYSNGCMACISNKANSWISSECE